MTAKRKTSKSLARPQPPVTWAFNLLSTSHHFCHSCWGRSLEWGTSRGLEVESVAVWAGTRSTGKGSTLLHTLLSALLLGLPLGGGGNLKICPVFGQRSLALTYSSGPEAQECRSIIIKGKLSPLTCLVPFIEGERKRIHAHTVPRVSIWDKAAS